MTGPRPDSPARRRFLRSGLALSVATVLAGCGDGGSESAGGADGTPTPEALSIGRFQFAAERPTGYREYEPVAEATYELGEAVWVYFEPAGVERESAGAGTDRIELSLEATFVDAEGEVQDRGTEPIEQEVTEDQSLEELYLWAGTAIPNDAPPGTWRVEIALTDEISGESKSLTREFDVQGDESTNYLEAFGSLLRSETDVAIESLDMDGATVNLAYDSSLETDTSEWRGEVGGVAGLFVRLVADGWEAERLSVLTTGADGRTMSWYLTRETALEFAAEEISGDEFGTRILETMEEQ